jgi:hypothetical protein
MDRLSQQYLLGVQNAKQRYLDHALRSKAIQDELLSAIIKGNAASRFGAEHQFGAIGSPEAFARDVPVRRYADLEAWIEASAEGEPQVLSDAPVVLFHRSSGTTGRSKKIPVTRDGARQRFSSVGAYRATLLQYHPEVLETVDAALSLTTSPPPVDALTKGGIPFWRLTETDWTALGFPRHPGSPTARAPWADVPSGIKELQYYRIRLSIESPLRAILSWFPASILHLASIVAAHSERLVREVRNGTVAGGIRRASNPQRAAELERVFSAPHGFTLKDVWPDLSVVECWTTSTSRFYQPQLRAALGPGVDIFPCGYGSTESPIAFAHGTEGAALLDIAAAYFEFIPADTDDTTRTLRHHELDTGRDYSVVLTTMSGLYRYRLGDVIRVLDSVNGVPLIEFRYRQGIVCSLISEKMTESQIIDAIADVLQVDCLERTAEAALCPVYESSPHYVLLVDGAVDRSADAISQLTAALESSLVDNVSYAFSRSKGLIAPPQVHFFARRTFALRRSELHLTGATALPQLKQRIVVDAAEREALQKVSDDIISRETPNPPAALVGHGGLSSL